MADSQNVELVRRFVDAFNRRDLESLSDRYDDDVELREWPTAPGARTYRGRDGIRAAMESWFEVWEWMRVEIEDLIESDDHVLVVLQQRAKGRGSEIEVEIRSFNVYTFRDGKIIRAELFTEREAAFAAAGLTANHEEEKR